MPEDHPKDTAGFTVPISGTPLSATPLPSISVPVPDPASPPNIDKDIMKNIPKNN